MSSSMAMTVTVNFNEKHPLDVDKLFYDISNIHYLRDQYILEDIFGEEYKFKKDEVETIVIG